MKYCTASRPLSNARGVTGTTGAAGGTEGADDSRALDGGVS